MQQLERNLDEMLVKKAPFQLPDSARQLLVKILPWLALLGGVLTLLGAWGVYQAVTIVDRWAGVLDGFGVAWGVNNYVAPTGMMPLLWISLVMLVVEGVLCLVAFPALQKYQKKGWDILFWLAIINAIQGIVHVIANANVYFNFGQLLLSLLGSLVGLYLLFQIRAYYTGEKKITATPSSGTASTMNVPKETPSEKPKHDSKKA